MSADGQTPKIVVSYRRTDSDMAGRIFDRLGSQSLYIDIDNIPFGADFREHIDDALKSSDLLIAIVGPKWLGERKGGTARIMQESDPVRVEIETALKRDIPVLPVLIGGEMMPDTAKLPDGLKDFAFRNAIEVSSARDFNMHVERLIGAVERILGAKAASPAALADGMSGLTAQAPPAPPQGKRFGLPLMLLGGLVALAGLAAAIWFARDRVRVAEQPPVATAAAFCKDLKRAVVEAPSKFVAVLGPESSGGWSARIQLSGWDDCTVRDRTHEGKTTRTFGCQRGPFATFAALRAERDKVDGDVKQCLGSEWSQWLSEVSDKTTDITYVKGQADPVVRLRESFNKDSNEWFLRIDVEARAAEATPSPQQAEPDQSRQIPPPETPLFQFLPEGSFNPKPSVDPKPKH